MNPPRVLRVASFLGDAAIPHHAAVAERAAAIAGFRAAELEHPGLANLDAVVARRGPALLFLCGLPYVRVRDAGARVEAVAAPVAPGDASPRYAATLVGRPGLEEGADAVLTRGRIGFNGRDSLSGWVLPRAGIRTRGLDPDAVDWIETGSHRTSLRMLVAGELDAASIDSFVLALEARLDPAIAALPVLAALAEAPSPPAVLVDGAGVDAASLGAALVGLADDRAGREALGRGLVARYAAVTDATYDIVRMLDRTEHDVRRYG